MYLDCLKPSLLRKQTMPKLMNIFVLSSFVISDCEYHQIVNVWIQNQSCALTFLNTYIFHVPILYQQSNIQDFQFRDRRHKQLCIQVGPFQIIKTKYISLASKYVDRAKFPKVHGYLFALHFIICFTISLVQCNIGWLR